MSNTDMRPDGASNPMRPKVTASVLFLASAALTLWLVLSLPFSEETRSFIALGSAFTFLVAGVAVYRNPQRSYLVGLLSGTAALYWFSRFELANFPMLNSWVMLNLRDGDFYFPLGKLRIFFAVAVATTTICAVVRLLPRRWTLRKQPLCERTWPALVICLVLVVCWYAVSVSPYRIPLIADSIWPDFTILHVEKDGIQFHETAFNVFRDGEVQRLRNDRRLFEYRFPVSRATMSLTPAVLTRVETIVMSPQLRNISTPPVTRLRRRNAEGWYIQTEQRVLAFTSENGTEPPPQLIGLFRDLESGTPREERLEVMKDVCLGFCYDPLAGLGYVYLNARCRSNNLNSCR